VPTRRSLREALQRHPGLKILSLVLAFFLWFSINVSERDAERIVELPVSVRRLPPGLIVTNLPAKPVVFTLRGPRTILDGVDERKVRVALDLSTAAPGETRIELNSDMIRPELPRRLKVLRVEPARLKMRVERLVRRRLPVRADLAGMPALGYTIAESTVTPGQVEVIGPASKVDELKEVTTETVDLRGAAETIQRDALLSWAGDFVSFSPEHVTVTVTFEEVMVSRDFKRVEVRIVNAAGVPAKVTPSQVDVTVRGPQRLLHNYRVPDGAVTVDASGLAPGAHRVRARIDLPQALEVTRRQPELLTLQVGDGGSR
jgi:YbbR domain-containing protein